MNVSFRFIQIKISKKMLVLFVKLPELPQNILKILLKNLFGHFSVMLSGQGGPKPHRAIKTLEMRALYLKINQPSKRQI